MYAHNKKTAMNIEEILNSNLTKSDKMRRLFDEGKSRKEVALLLGVGYGFVQNVYAKYFSNRPLSPEGDFVFSRSFGIELEIIHNNKRELCDAVRSRGISCEIEGYNHSTRCHWKIVSDASVNGGYELVSPVLKGQRGLDEIKAVCEALAEVGALINKSCGFHAHFGTDDFKDSISVWRNLYINYATLEEDIDAFMPPSRRHNRYCSSLKVRNWREKMDSAQTLVDLERAVTNRSRYFKLNSQSYWRHGTVEFRQHSGTIEFDKIKNWLLFCARFVDFSKRERLDRGGECALEKFLDRGLADFYKQRKQKFERR